MSRFARMLFSVVAALAAVLFVATPARAQDHAAPKTAEHAPAAQGEHAAGHEEAGVIPSAKQGVISGVATIIVFSLVLAILGLTVWPKILGGLKDREEKIRSAIEEAELARTKAKEALDQYQKSLADARSEAAKMLETTRAQQAALAAELKSKADIELTQMRERALKDIESAKRAAVSEIYTQAGQLAASMAGKILRRSVNPGDTQQLVEESLAQLGARN